MFIDCFVLGQPPESKPVERDDPGQAIRRTAYMWGGMEDP